MRWVLSGVVQGVGFRPFVYRLAQRHGVSGWVKNRTGQVEVVACGSADQLEAFAGDLIARAPAISQPEIQQVESPGPLAFERFEILDSESNPHSDIHLPVDYFVCDDCLHELNDPSDRRYRYPFINCTQCGPRYTLIDSLPYDRENTSMRSFRLCSQCEHEYLDPADRRFHAEPVACPVCGPQLQYKCADTVIRNTPQALDACVQALGDGLIIAVKGVGGYHLMCDAGNPDAITRLRLHKPRPHKPLAVMFENIPSITDWCGENSLCEDEEKLLRSPSRPVVLARKKHPSQFQDLAPGLGELGVMLPYSPLHHLLLNDFGGPLVATSANISGEPVLTDADAVEERLAHIADAFLHHDRPIVRPADDSVYRNINGKPRPLRLGRGRAPLEMPLPFTLEKPVLAVGGHTKNTLCLAWQDRAVISPHIGDMGSLRSEQVFATLVDDLQVLYDVQVEEIVCDLHGGYSTTRWASHRNVPSHAVQHHVAHASALAGEYDPRRNWLVFSWDGVGLGDDEHLWGGEGLYGRPGQWRRVSSMREFRLPGGEKAGRDPWRSAAGLCWEVGRDWPTSEHELLHQAWQKKMNAPLTSAVGRLFDAAAAIAGVCTTTSFEGQGPTWLEALCKHEARPVLLPLCEDVNGIWRSDWEPLLDYLLDSHDASEDKAACFHASMARALIEQVLKLSSLHPVDAVGLCGGVFQNRVLTELVINELKDKGIAVVINQQIPMNDAGLCFGQVVEHAANYTGS